MLDVLFVCLESHIIIGHVFVECSFDPPSSFFLITYCLTDATDWNQIKNPVQSGRSDPKHTDYEPKFRIDVSSEHTPIDLPTRNMSFQQEYDATITASDDFYLPRHSGASSSSQHRAASTFPTSLKLGSLGTTLTKVSADHDSVASGTSIKETCADMDRETVVSCVFGSVSKGKRDRDPNVVQTLRDRQNLNKILERTAELAARGETLAQQRKYEAEADVWRSNIGKRE